MFQGTVEAGKSPEVFLAPFTMAPKGSKEAMVQELEKHNVQVPKGMSVPELSTLLKRLNLKDEPRNKKLTPKEDYMSSMSNLRKDTLAQTMISLGGIPHKKDKKGDILLWIREHLPLIGQEKMKFGKYAEMTIDECARNCQPYVGWALGEQKAASSEGLIKFVAYCKVIYKGLLKDEQSDSEEEIPKKEFFVKKEPKEEETEESQTMKSSKATTRFPKGGSTASSGHGGLHPPAYAGEKGKKPEKFRMNADEEEEELSDTPPSSAPSWMEIGVKRRH